MDIISKYKSILEVDNFDINNISNVDYLEKIYNELIAVKQHDDYSKILDYIVTKTHLLKLFKNAVTQKDHERFIIIFVKLLEIITPIFCGNDRPTEFDVTNAICVGETVLDAYYAASPPPILTVPLACTQFRFYTLMLLTKITDLSSEFAESRISELIGIFKANVIFGLNRNLSDLCLIIQRVTSSQQSYDGDLDDELLGGSVNDDFERNVVGGKVLRKRKLRVGVPNATSSNETSTTFNAVDRLKIWDLKENMQLSFHEVTPSDSDVSTSEALSVNEKHRHIVNRPQPDHHQNAKVRQAAITLLSIVTRINKRSVLYGYWHALFPSGSSFMKESKGFKNTESNNLLYISRHDPSVRCRRIALQVAAQLILDSKSFLSLAEYDEKRSSTNFLPYSQSLGLMVLGMFEAITEILEKEWTRSVIIQALKCLAVLVQATTPFHRFQPRDFIARFVDQVRHILRLKDHNVQVSALIVIEFLVNSAELTPEIAVVFNFPSSKIKSAITQCRVKDDAPLVDELISTDCCEEEYEQIEDEEEEIEEWRSMGNCLSNNDDNKSSNPESCEPLKAPSWLLDYIFENFFIAANPFCIECLQVITAMGKHLELLLPYITQVSKVLSYSLPHSEVNLRFHSARCLDQIAYQISQYLLQINAQSFNKSNITTIEDQSIDQCHQFWSTVMPIVVDEIQSERTSPVVCSTADNSENSIKASLCDALANIGPIIFEHQPHNIKISLLGFLSGVASEDERISNNVNVSAVRALAIYASFPSLRNDLVFIENTLEIALRLAAKQNNLPVRIKAVWSMGNITDILTTNYLNRLKTDKNTAGDICSESRISNNLYWRLFECVLEACNDKDKVRCNAVRVLGNLLLLFTRKNFVEKKNRSQFQKGVSKLIGCLRSGKYVKVKWNACYAIGSLLRNESLFEATEAHNDLDWQDSLYPEICNNIIYHSNFKVRINASIAIGYIAKRSNFSQYYELFCSSTISAIEQSHHLDNFYEYNHRDQLQEQLCLIFCHLINLAGNDDFIMIKRHLDVKFEIVRSTWSRVINRMVPEKAAPLLKCQTYLHDKLTKKTEHFTMEQSSAIRYIIDILNV